MKKILFNDFYALTQAVLDGRKTQTRRIIPNCTGVRQSPFSKSGIEDSHGYELKPKYHVGEVVAVAQSYSQIGIEPFPFCEAGWRNKLFVQASKMRHFIRITDVRVERLNDISESDCIAEGVLHSDKYAMPYGIPYNKAPNGVDFYYSTPREAYAALIDRISGKGVWKSNPYVFVYEFELVK